MKRIDMAEWRRAGVRISALLAFSIMTVLVGGCPATDDSGDDESAGVSTNDGSTSGGAAPSDTSGGGTDGGFLYVLQPDAVSVAQLSSAAFRRLVLEPSRDGDAASEFSRTEIDAMRAGACREKIILAYLSIGEAENYRDYWNASWTVGADGPPIAGVAPDWLGPTNPEWRGNYKVRYWEQAWQDVILGTPEGSDTTPLDRIIAAGFDGVYLDIVDAFEFWSDPDEGQAELSRAEARARMIAWVVRIADYARVTCGATDFLVFPQNAEEIIYNDAGELDARSAEYLAAINGIGIEDLFYSETTATSDADRIRRTATLAEFRSRDKTVLVTDYVLAPVYTPANSGARAANFYRRARDAGFIPYAAVSSRELDAIVVLDDQSWPIAQPPACEAAP